MHFDLFTALLLTGLMFVGGLIAVPLGGSRTFVMPALFLLGFDAKTALFMSIIGIYAASFSSSSYLLKTNTTHWRVIAILSGAAIAGIIVASWLISKMSVEFLGPAIAWLVVGGGLLSLYKFKLPPMHTRHSDMLTGCGNFLAALYGTLGGSGQYSLMGLLLHNVYHFDLKNALIHLRIQGMLTGWITIVAFIYFGFTFTGYELPVVIGGMLGGVIGGMILDRLHDSWIRWIFLTFAIVMAVKVTFW